QYDLPGGRFALHAGDDFLCHRTRGFLVTRKVHGVGRAALGAGTHVRRVTKHFRQRHNRLDDLRSGAMFHAFDAATPRTQVAHDGAGEVFGNHDLHRHYRLKNHRAGLACRFFKGHRTSNLECHFVRIDFVIAAVVQRGLHVHHRIAGENAAFHGFLHALIDRLDVFLGYDAADDIVYELVSLARLVRLQADLHVTILAAAAGLTNVFAFRLGVLANGFTIGDLRFADISFHRKLAHHAVDDDLEMQFAHAADDGLPAIRVGVDLERRIFLGKLGKRDALFLLIALGLRLYCDRDHRRGELDGLKEDRVLLIANGVAGRDVAKTYASANVAGVDLADFLTLVGVHFQQASNTFAALLAAVED